MISNPLYYVLNLVSKKILFLGLIIVNTNFAVRCFGNNYDINDSINNPLMITSITSDKNIILCSVSKNGILKSTDYGNNWQLVNKGLIQDEENNIIGIKKINNKYVAWNLKDRLYFSDDTAKSWKIYSTFFDSNNIFITDLTPISDSVIYLSSNKGMYLSLDDGKRWNFVTEFAEDYYGSIYNINDTIYISNNTIYFKHINEKEWNSFRNIPKKGFIFSDIAFLRNRTIISTDMGVYYTTDFGEHWTDITYNMLIPTGHYDGIIRVFSIDDNLYICKKDGLYLFNEEINYWYNCNIIINDSIIDTQKYIIFPSVMQKYNNCYYLGTLYNGLFRSADGINFYYVDFCIN